MDDGLSMTKGCFKFGLVKYIVTCMNVTIDGIWIGNWIYLAIKNCNYK
jgi:hypothetical protein